MEERMIAHCGLDCAACEAFVATQAGDRRKMAEVAAQWSAQFQVEIKPGDVVCDGCRMDGRRSAHCEHGCEIRRCCLGRGCATCIECGDFPCQHAAFVLEHAPGVRDNLEKMRK